MNQSSRTRGRRRTMGFTLVELMIVVSIIAIIASLAIFLLGRGGEERDVRGLSTEIAQRMLSARMTAISRGQSVRVSLTVYDDSDVQLQMELMQPVGLGDERVEGCFPSLGSEMIFERDYGPGTSNFPNAAVMTTWPAPVGGVATYCFMPSGRVLSSVGLPLNSGLDQLSGNGYIEVAGMRRSGQTWVANPIRRLFLQVPLNGQITQMPPSFARDIVAQSQEPPDDGGDNNLVPGE